MKWTPSNRHAKTAVCEHYRETGIERVRTDQAGAVTTQLGATLAMSKYKETNARYWRGR